MQARKEDPILQDELSIGELIAIAKYHLDYVIARSAAGQRDNEGAQTIHSHLEEVLMVTAQALSIWDNK